MTAQEPPAIQQSYLESLDTLYRQVYLVLVLLIAFTTYAAAIRFFYYFRGEFAGLLISLLCALAISIPLRRKYLRPATWVLLLGAMTAAALETLAIPVGPAKFTFSLVIALASLTLSTRALVAVGTASFVFLLGMVFWVPSEQPDFTAAALLSAALTAVFFLGIRLLLASLYQATQYVRMANTAMSEARSERGRLVQTVKALDEGNYRLQKAYQKIALARDEANQAREMKIQFANMISHELRAPLNFIIGVTDIMVKSPDLYGKENWTPELNEDLRRLYESASHLSHMIDDVLTLGKIEANRVALRFEPSSIVEVIKDVLVIIQPSYEHRNLYLRLEVEPGIPTLQLDRLRIRQVMLNLLNNAYRFMHSGGVVISVRRKGSDVLVSVEDTGVGIPANQIDKLFQNFFQVESSAGSEGASGLGLSISQQFIKLHGGHIWVESNLHPGSSTNGTRFSFTLPANVTGPILRNDEQERYFWKMQNDLARKNRPIIVFTELAVDDLLTAHSLSDYKINMVSDREQVEHQIHVLQPSVFMEITGGNESLLSEQVQRVLLQENIPYLHCQVTQEDTGVEPQWDEYLVKPFSIDQVCQVIEEISPRAARCIVVDDDENILRLFELGLSLTGRYGLQLLQASTGQEACALLEKELPDILFLDINLPDMNGMDLLRQIREEGRSKALPVVIISSCDKPFLYKTRVERIQYVPGQVLDREMFISEIEGFLDSIRSIAKV